MDENEIKFFVEAALLASGRPLSIDQLQNLFDVGAQPEKAQIRQAISGLQQDYEPRGLEIAEVASGFRTQIKASMADQLQKLWEERPPRYSRALFETLALIAYRQPMTRGEIEEIRGVSVSSNIIRSLLERDWIRVVGHRDVPGRPAMFGTTRTFLDYFGLKKLDDLPPLADLSDWENLRVQLNLPEVSNDEAAVSETAEITELRVEAAETESADDQPPRDEELPETESADDQPNRDEEHPETESADDQPHRVEEPLETESADDQPPRGEEHAAAENVDDESSPDEEEDASEAVSITELRAARAAHPDTENVDEPSPTDDDDIEEPTGTSSAHH